MAFSVGSSGGYGRSRFRGANGTLSEINVVPLVDVVLVLLIIFMLTAHVMEFGLEVEVPTVKQVRNTAEELPVVTITKNGETYLAEKPVNINTLGETVRRRYPNNKGVYLRAEKGTVWDPIAQVISKLGESKLDVRVVTQPEDEAGSESRMDHSTPTSWTNANRCEILCSGSWHSTSDIVATVLRLRMRFKAVRS